jgi:hypothetical protein
LFPEEDAEDKPRGARSCIPPIQGTREGAIAMNERFENVWDAIEETPAQA